MKNTYHSPLVSSERRRHVIRAAVAAGILLFAAHHLGRRSNHEPEAKAAEPQSTRATVLFNVSTPEGKVECMDKLTDTVGFGGTVSGLVETNVARVTDANSFMTPDLSPIVQKVLEINHITDPTKVGPEDSIIVPDFCEYAPE